MALILIVLIVVCGILCEIHWIVGLSVFLLIAFFGILSIVLLHYPSLRSSRSKSQRSINSVNSILQKNQDWLDKRFELVDKARNSSDKSIFPCWYFDKPTDRQIRILKVEGIKVRRKDLTKGKASDLIGLFVQPDPEKLEILRFFKVPLKDMNQSRAIHEVAMIMSDAVKCQAWRDRPATTLQKEFYRYMGRKVPKGLKYCEASDFYNNPDADPEHILEWEKFESLYEDICNPDKRNNCKLKKITPNLLMKAWKSLRDEEITPDDIISDYDIIVDRICKIMPA